jgi:DNA-binding CsgD family transcriptional regulator
VDAADAADAAGRADLLAAAALAVHDVGSPEVPAVVARLAERALAVTGDGSPALRARLLAQLASALADDSRFERSDALSAEALALAETTGDPEAMVDAVRARIKSTPVGLDPAERLRLGRLAVGLGATTGQPLVALWGHKWRIDAALEVGTVAAVDDELAAVTALARATGLPLVRWHDLRLRASVLALRGRFAEGCVLNDEAAVLARAELAEDRSAIGMSFAFQTQLALVTGDTTGWDHDGIVASLASAPGSPIVQVTRALLPLLQGRREEAAAQYEEVRARVADPGFASMVQGVPVDLVPLVEEFADRETAAFLHDFIAARPFASGGAGIFCSEPADLYLGRLSVVLGRLDDAVGCFQRSTATAARMGARPAVVLGRVGLAGALLDRGGGSDLGAARTAARQALDEARRLGMPGPARRAAALLARAEAEDRSRDPLTAREREIADLVADALTNRQIADRLVLSERTVESHVRNVLAKLGVANRTGIAATRPAARRSAAGPGP